MKGGWCDEICLRITGFVFFSGSVSSSFLRFRRRFASGEFRWLLVRRRLRDPLSGVVCLFPVGIYSCWFCSA
jgi:hypothetical protein